MSGNQARPTMSMVFDSDTEKAIKLLIAGLWLSDIDEQIHHPLSTYSWSGFTLKGQAILKRKLKDIISQYEREKGSRFLGYRHFYQQVKHASLLLDDSSTTPVDSTAACLVALAKNVVVPMLIENKKSTILRRLLLLEFPSLRHIRDDQSANTEWLLHLSTHIGERGLMNFRQSEKIWQPFSPLIPITDLLEAIGFNSSISISEEACAIILSRLHTGPNLIQDAMRQVDQAGLLSSETLFAISRTVLAIDVSGSDESLAKLVIHDNGSPMKNLWYTFELAGMIRSIRHPENEKQVAEFRALIGTAAASNVIAAEIYEQTDNDDIALAEMILCTRLNTSAIENSKFRAYARQMECFLAEQPLTFDERLEPAPSKEQLALLQRASRPEQSDLSYLFEVTLLRTQTAVGDEPSFYQRHYRHKLLSLLAKQQTAGFKDLRDLTLMERAELCGAARQALKTAQSAEYTDESTRLNETTLYEELITIFDSPQFLSHAELEAMRANIGTRAGAGAASVAAPAAGAGRGFGGTNASTAFATNLNNESKHEPVAETSRSISPFE